MAGHLSNTRQPAVSYMMFRFSGAHTLDEFRRSVSRDLDRHPSTLSSLQLSQSGWLMTYAVEEAALRENRADLLRCLDWLQAMVTAAAVLERASRQSAISDKLRQRISQVFRLRDASAMLQFKANRLYQDGHLDEARECFARLQDQTRQTSRPMGEHAARAFGDMLLQDCRTMLQSQDNTPSDRAFQQTLQSYLDLGLFKATRLHWNFLSAAVDGHARGWLDLPAFIADWRPDTLQVGPSHQDEARTALSKLRSALPLLRPDQRDAVESFVNAIENVPWGQPLSRAYPQQTPRH